jgi:hypothetical protein
MQYFGYLRRDPDAAPDVDFNGYNFWLAKLEGFGADYRRAEMVKAFLLPRLDRVQEQVRALITNPQRKRPPVIMRRGRPSHFTARHQACQQLDRTRPLSATQSDMVPEPGASPATFNDASIWNLLILPG